MDGETGMRIYVMSHKKYSFPPDPIYVPMQVGRAVHEPLGYIGDDTGDNISSKNEFYSELTGMYWIWKNDNESDPVGMCHYRRFLLDDDEQLLTEAKIREYLSEYDLITTKLLQLNCTYYDGFAADHNQADMDIVADIIKEYEPAYYDVFMSTVHDTRTYFGNMIITSEKLFKAYSEWLFGILEKAEKSVDMTGYDGYQKRLYGFISEILLLVWIRVNRLRVRECRVGMIGEKKETGEIEANIAGFFRSRDIAGAKAYILDCLAVRPDVLMEASDIYGNLKAAMQIISTAEFELAAGKPCILECCRDFDTLTDMIKMLNDVMMRKTSGVSTPEDEAFLEEHAFSSEALMIAGRIAD